MHYLFFTLVSKSFWCFEVYLHSIVLYSHLFGKCLFDNLIPRKISGRFSMVIIGRPMKNIAPTRSVPASLSQKLCGGGVSTWSVHDIWWNLTSFHTIVTYLTTFPLLATAGGELRWTYVSIPGTRTHVSPQTPYLQLKRLLRGKWAECIWYFVVW